MQKVYILRNALKGKTKRTVYREEAAIKYSATKILLVVCLLAI